jgi:catechol 2,3-dioxygenase-like lactoylglutathione lyase family enzyme
MRSGALGDSFDTVLTGTANEEGSGMAVQAIDLRVDDVSAATQMLSAAYGWRVLSEDPNFGELDAGGLRVMLSRDAMVPWGDLNGLILHHYVDDVEVAAKRAVAAGAELLLGPLRTDWGTEAAYLRGPDQLIVDLCRDV